MTDQKTEQEKRRGMKFRKTALVEAIQWTGDNLVDVIEFTDGYRPTVDSVHASMRWEDYADLVRRDGLKIRTMEGWLRAAVGDWILKGIKGEVWPCARAIFEATYESAEGGHG